MQPDNFPLSGESLRNWLRTSGQSIFTLFETGQSALEYARSQGMSIRTQDFYEIRRQVLSTHAYEDQFTSYGDEGLIPAAWHVEDHGLSLSENFLYRLRVTGTDPATGDPVERYFAIASDRQLTPGQAKDILGDMIVGEETFYEIIAEEIEVTAALARPGVF